MVSAKAESQTDARCYLAKLLTRPAKVTMERQDRILRIVGEEHNLYQQNYDEIDRRYEGTSDDKTWTHKVTFWDKDHGIEVNDRVRVEVRSKELNSFSILEGTATEVVEHEVHLSGSEWFDIQQKDHGLRSGAWQGFQPAPKCSCAKLLSLDAQTISVLDAPIECGTHHSKYSSSSKRVQELNTGKGAGRTLSGSLILKAISSRSNTALTEIETPDVGTQSEHLNSGQGIAALKRYPRGTAQSPWRRGSIRCDGRRP